MRWMLVLAGALVAAGSTALAQPPAKVTAFVGATVVPMDRDGVLPNHTVLVDHGRIVRVGPTDSVKVPPGATIIDAGGRFLLPGLADMHVHLALKANAVTEFRDAPLYLANGVTTVLNLRGDSAQLAWRREIAAGTLLGPTIYTAGRFVNEPVVNTPDEAEREVRAQAAAGYDVIKFREVVDTNLHPLTTHGLSRETYHRMMETARQLGIPVTGHGPNNLGLAAALEEKQSLAHVGYTLVATYFWPLETPRFKAMRRLGISALVLLGAIAVGGWVALAVGARRRRDLARWTAWVAVITTILLASCLLVVRESWGTDGLVKASRMAMVIAVAAGLGLGAVALLWVVLRVRTSGGPAALLVSAIGALATVLTLAGSVLGYWAPLAWRATDRGLATLGRDVARASIWVTPTLQVYRSAEVAANPEVRYVQVPAWWESFRDPSPGRRAWASNTVRFLQRVVGALHRAGVPLLAGTDAMWAYVIPGFALHDELGLLEASGLSRYEVLRTATTEPARFLRVPNEFGMVAPGRRADLVLVAKNPLDDLSTLRTPVGVMVRGRWLAASELEAMLAPLAGRRP